MEVYLDVATFDTGATEFTLAAARYAPAGSHAVTGADFSLKRYLATATTGLLPPMAGIDLGTVDIYSGSKSYNHVKVTFGYTVALAGVSDGATYLFQGPNADTPAATSGTFALSALWPGTNEGTDGETRPLEGQGLFTLRLRRDGTLYDVIYLLIPISGTLRFLTAASATQPVVSSGLTVTDTLYGAGTEPGTVAPPALPLAGYSRESFAARGTVTIP